MFYKMIESACNRWYSSSECTVNELVQYIKKDGHMRDAQIGAIRLYLFFKIKCECRPLPELFIEGSFNNVDLEEEEFSGSLRKFLKQNKAAAALYEYATLKTDDNKQVSEILEREIRQHPESIDYEQFFRDAFYGVTYADYLYSLPMGAGKTFLMAAFIYLDLYFALNEPTNPMFAHNFIILAPSGLKSSIVPSLKTIQSFDVSWVLPEPSASIIKQKLYFEILDQQKTSNSSNRVKNPNVQKIARYQPLSELFGLIVVTNAEKVIINHLAEKDLFEYKEEEQERYKASNELRALIGKIPHLAIFIDEVHHAVNEDIKLRKVVSRWVAEGSVNSVLGFSGTPYLEKAEKVKINDKLTLSMQDISNTVFFYPLINGIGNFLKKPIVKISDEETSTEIVDRGIREFLEIYRDTVYDGGLVAKLAIYCGTISKLETIIYPLAKRIATEYGLGDDVILKFHRGDKEYQQPVDSQLKFDSLDTSISKVKIVLLVQIGKEGWDCRSLTGVILSQEGDCPKNMVLQTSCRCLRQVGKNDNETALIYLNGSNAKKLEEQLSRQQRATIRDFMSGNAKIITLDRYDRRKYLNLPSLSFYQLTIKYNETIVEKSNPSQRISLASEDSEREGVLIWTTDFTLKNKETHQDLTEKGSEHITFNNWLYSISKEGFCMVSYQSLWKYHGRLKEVFDKITFEKDGCRFYSSKWDIQKVNSNIRKAFSDRRDFISKEEYLPYEASLLNIANFTSSIQTNCQEDYYPDSKSVEKIVLADAGRYEIPREYKGLIDYLEKVGLKEEADKYKKEYDYDEHKDISYHYLPYHTDSAFEQVFLKEILSFDIVREYKLEVYYNGDKFLSDFRIQCYKKINGKSEYIGLYTPDFLILQRKDGKIDKIVIVETKGSIYAAKSEFLDKRNFVETRFVHFNNQIFKYGKFDYLYLEDSLSVNERINKTMKKLKDFFGGIR